MKQPPLLRVGVEGRDVVDESRHLRRARSRRRFPNAALNVREFVTEAFLRIRPRDRSERHLSAFAIYDESQCPVDAPCRVGALEDAAGRGPRHHPSPPAGSVESARSSITGYSQSELDSSIARVTAAKSHPGR